MSKEQADTFNVTIEKLVYGGAGLTRHQGKVVFVPFSVPDDQLQVYPVENKKSYIRATIKKILNPGNGRIDPACPHFGKCGGCDWQHLDYTYQVEAKRQILAELFHHKLPETETIPIRMRKSSQSFAYRSRARMQIGGFGPNTAIGFFRSGSHIIEDIENCPLFQPSLNEALHALHQFNFKTKGNTPPQEMDLVCSDEEGTWATAPIEINHQNEGVLQRKIGNFTYSVNASVFFQANDFIVPDLVDHVMACAKDTGNNHALDLFSGVGLFSLPLACRFQNVIAVENSTQSCQFCAENAANAGLTNIRTVRADVVTWMQSESVRGMAPLDLVVLDPPRTGANQEIFEHLRQWAPQTIIYVSCDPQTLVRDLALLTPRHYKIDSIEGFDMFPQTYHFETVVRLRKA
jgi:23S rRNA (uracil1939-C5)-methyltransferase